MAFVGVYDACVLYPISLCDLLMRLAQTGLFRAKWTERILDECFRNILADRPDLKPEQLHKRRIAMSNAIRDVLVENHEPAAVGLSSSLPDPDDAHVLAAAIVSGAQVIVTANLRDFPASALKPYAIEAQHPDEFVLNLIDLAPMVVGQVIVEQAASKKKPPMTVDDVLTALERRGLVRSVAMLRQLGSGS